MIQFLRTWANQIIVVIIIATILEMLLPNGNNKKYIKMIIGLYVLLAIIQPIFSKLTGNNIAIESFNYQKYFKKSNIETSSDDFEKNNTKLINHAYLENVKNDIRTKLQKRGYVVTKSEIQTIEEQGENYGNIQKVSLSIKKENKSVKNEEKNNTVIQIDDVNVQVGNNTIQQNKEKDQISEKEKQEIIDYLSNEYAIEKTKIVIN